MPKYEIQTGDFSGSKWVPGSYSIPIEAVDLGSAKIEADRRLRTEEIKGFEKGADIRVTGPDGSAIRRIDGGTWPD